MYDLYEIENPDPIPNVHFFVRKENTTISTDASTHPVDIKLITNPDQFNDKRLLDYLEEHDPDIKKMYDQAMSLPKSKD
jgi:hypothetical protein